MGKYVPLEQRFWRKVDKDGPTNDYVAGKCWQWTGAKTKAGYGLLGGERNGKSVYAHRLSFELHCGHIPDNVSHLCNNPQCVNPAHLENGTRKDNQSYMAKCGRGKGQFAKGSAPKNKRLTQKQTEEILSTPPKYGSATKLANKFGISVSTICYVRKKHGV